MRLITTFMLAAVLVLGVWSFVSYEPFLLGPSPDGYSWWWPKEISSFGENIDFLFLLISGMILVFFVLTMGLLVYFVLKYSAKREDKAVFSHGNHKLEMLWTAIPASLLLVIAFSQMSTWANIKFAGATQDEEGKPLPVFAEIWASQFDWNFRYPGADGRFGTEDDISSSYELVLPLRDKEKFVFSLRSRDVLHSFFVPMLRVKQDAVPGMTIPVWFDIEAEEFHDAFPEGTDPSFDIICAELCGWGHYKMAGRIRILPEDEYAAWMEAKVAEKYGNL